MIEYEQRQQNKKERLQARAEKIRAEASARYKKGHEALSAIPFGQPILVGHHSEKSDRAYRGRAVGNIDKSFELSNYADNLEQRAESVGTGGISADDPEAVQKLREKLEKLQLAHEMMKSKNAQAHARGEERPFARYQLANSGQNINSVKKRIESLEKRASMETRADIVRDTFTVHEDKEDNRIQFIFEGKPAEEVRRILKSNGFKWSPTRTAWVRQLNNAGRYATDRVLSELVK
jgi:hypothetical protein